MPTSTNATTSTIRSATSWFPSLPLTIVLISVLCLKPVFPSRVVRSRTIWTSNS
ncbi:hypothetical protein DPMN_067607 [Dreissena polymorpha]|uniref:Uncharacterized protein n=1 Tax=Dreissena polymorpha TaxID=45954 RepID=A0A9D4BTP4_DREPO|nr:hypothetical protein DPMN_067607 [Dreissena polymorpha]